MSTFETLTSLAFPNFSIDVPEGTVDASTYAFVLPVKARFRPSIVIKWEKMPLKTRLGTHITEQIEQMEEKLRAFTLVEPPDPTIEADENRILFEWGEGDERRFRQVQHYLLRKGRLYTLTGTMHAEKQVQYQDQLEEIMATFKPQ